MKVIKGALSILQESRESRPCYKFFCGGAENQQVSILLSLIKIEVVLVPLSWEYRT